MPAARRLRALILAPVAPAAAAAPDPNVVEPSPEESALAAELVARGWVHMKSQLGAGELAALVDEIEATAADDSCGDMEEGGVKSLRNLWNRSATFVGMLDKDPVTVVAEHALGSGSGPGGGGSPPEHNHVVSMIATATAPGAGGEAAHLDFLPMEVDEELLRDGVIELPLFITTALYCLSGGVAEIGIVPDSHLAGREPADGEETLHGQHAQQIEVEAGDVIMYRCDAWKTVFSNGSDDTRYALRVHYSQPHIGHRFQPYVAEGGETGFQFNPEIVAMLNPRQRRLLGEHPHYGYD